MFNPQKSTVFTSPVTGQIFMLAPNQQFLVPQTHILPIQQPHHQPQQQQQGDSPSSQVQQFFRIGPPLATPLPQFQSIGEHLQQHGPSFNLNSFITQEKQKCHSTKLKRDRETKPQPADLQQSQVVVAIESPNSNQHSRNKSQPKSQTKASKQHPKNYPLVEPLNQCRSPPPLSIDVTFEKKCLTHYIDGQLIYETSKLLKTTKKAKKQVKKKKAIETSQQLQQQQQSTGSDEVLPKVDNEMRLTKLMHQPNSGKKSLDPVTCERNAMPDWTVADVVKFIESIPDIQSYSNKFEENEIDGKALLLLIDRNLNLQTLASMFKHGPAMKIEAALFKYKINGTEK